MHRTALFLALALVATASYAQESVRDIDIRALQKHLVEIGNLAPSALTDVATGLPSELDAQVMAVSRAGDEVGVPTPVFDVVGAVLAPREAAAREEAAARAGR